MADLSKLAEQFNSYMALVPIESSSEIKTFSKYRIIGTIADFHPTGSKIAQENTPTESGVWRGNTTLDVIIQDGQGEVKIEGKFVGEDGEARYKEINLFLKVSKKLGLMKNGYTKEELDEERLKEERMMEERLMGEDLNETGVIGMGTGNRKGDNRLYMVVWNNQYFVRGPDKGDFLQRFHYKNALEKGLIKLPETKEDE